MMGMKLNLRSRDAAPSLRGDTSASPIRRKSRTLPAARLELHNGGLRGMRFSIFTAARQRPGFAGARTASSHSLSH
jgi:hypothetical protein